MFDGKIARTKKDRTEEEKCFGIQIDSLCDIVCFALGLPHQELGFEKLCVSPDELLRKIDAAQAAKAAAAKADEATEEAKA